MKDSRISWSSFRGARHVHEHVEYYPYGEVWIQPKGDEEAHGSTLTKRLPDFLFTSKEFDEETGLTYFGARYYDSKRARWLSTDGEPFQQGPVGLSFYAYGGHNPLKLFDPDGRSLNGPADYLRILFKGEVQESDVNDYKQHPVAHGVGFLSSGVALAATLIAAALSGGELIAMVSEGGAGAGGLGAANPLQFAGVGGLDVPVLGLSGAQTATIVVGATAVTTTVVMSAPKAPSGSTTRPTEKHHIATDKNTTSTARGGPWTPRFKALFDKAGVSLQDEANLVDVEGHEGPHPEEYHEEVYERLKESTKGLKEGTAEYTEAFKDTLRQIGKEIQTTGSRLNKLVAPPP